MIGVPNVVSVPRPRVFHGVELDDIGVSAIDDTTLIDVDFLVGAGNRHKFSVLLR